MLHNWVCLVIFLPFVQVWEAQLAQYSYILVVGEEEAKWTGDTDDLLMELIYMASWCNKSRSAALEKDADHSVMSIDSLLKLFNDVVADFR